MPAMTSPFLNIVMNWQKIFYAATPAFAGVTI
jgi:hypothetical protein